MFKNYLLTAFRSFKRNKLTTLINVFGLSIGISAALIIYFIVQYDYSFDKFEPDGNRIYRIVTDGEEWKNPGVPVPLHEEMSSRTPGLQTVALIMRYNGDAPKISIPKANNSVPAVLKQQSGFAFADSNYFSLFPHQWLAGNPANSLNSIYNIVLTQSRAQLYFPNIPVNQLTGKTIIFDDTVPMTVTGVVKDLQQNSDFKFDAFISLSTAATAAMKDIYSWNEWSNTNSNFQTLIKIQPGVQPAQVNKQVTALFKTHRTDPDDTKTKVHLQPLSDIHYNPDYGGVVNFDTLRNLVLLVVFLLLLGAINFINLSTAQSVQRAKEIGIRKTLGSSKGNLILQFLTETFLLSSLATLLSIAMSPILMAVFSGFIPEGLQLSQALLQPSIGWFLLLLITVVSLLAGLYPAFILSRFKPVKVLKNQSSSASGTTRSAWLRQSLLVFQFVIAQVFIIGVIVVDKQVHYSMEKDMGFRKDAIINIELPFDFVNTDPRKYVFTSQLRSLQSIQAVSLGNTTPAINGQMSTTLEYKEGNKNLKLNVDSRDGDTAYIGVYGIHLIAGRNVMAADTTSELLVNETLAKQLGFANPADAVGHFANYGGPALPIVGVMKDFNLTSVRTAIHPLIFHIAPKYGYMMHIALQPNPDTWQTSIAGIQKIWAKLYPEKDFDYSFFDKRISDFYKEDRQLSLLLTWSAAIAVSISCLGLLGLIIFITNQRTKEIGVRKVLGATVTQIIALLSGAFAKLILVAFVIAIPVAWWLTHNWLQNFSYRTELSWWIFPLSGSVIIFAALLILSIRAGKAAMMNPVKSLRTE